ncbi:MAG: sporulation protein YunB [Eubacteriales bacterium]|nr:sporulation protein YunB [Eubacteriales bacterium]
MRGWRHSNNKKNISGNKKAKLTVLLVFILMLSIIMFVQYKKQIEPNIDAISVLKAKGIVTEIINQTIREGFTSEEYSDDNLLIVKIGDDGKIQMVQSNTKVINKMVSEFAEALQEKYSRVGEQKIKVSYGSVLGSKVLSQMKLYMNLRILPLSVSNFDFETEFETQGINQTKYKIFITIKSNVRVLEPFSATNFDIKNRVLIAEAVIIGDVPNSYVMVPKEDILDVTDE